MARHKMGLADGNIFGANEDYIGFVLENAADGTPGATETDKKRCGKMNKLMKVSLDPRLIYKTCKPLCSCPASASTVSGSQKYGQDVVFQPVTGRRFWAPERLASCRSSQMPSSEYSAARRE